MDARPRRIRFAHFDVDVDAGTVRQQGRIVDVPARLFQLLRVLLLNHDRVISKQELVEQVWNNEVYSDGTIDQAISALRRMFGARHDGAELIVAHRKRGFRFALPIEQVTVDGEAPRTLEAPAARATTAALASATAQESGPPVDLASLLSPQLAFINSRAALEALDRERIPDVIAACRPLLAEAKYAAGAQVVLANALVLRFESTRAGAAPDYEALTAAEDYARAACQAVPRSADAWAALAHAMHRRGRAADALAAAREAISLEPGEWRFHLRLGFIAGGAERLRAATRVLDLSPRNPLAQWLAATVFIARQVFPVALRHLEEGCDAQDRLRGLGDGRVRVHAVGLHWLRGLVLLRLGRLADARDALQRELTFEDSGHVVGREVCAATWYALGALDMRGGDRGGARAAFAQALQCVPQHAATLVALQAAAPPAGARRHDPMSTAVTQALALALAGQHRDASQVVCEALRAHPASGPGSAWIVPVEPLLNVAAAPEAYGPLLDLLLALAS